MKERSYCTITVLFLTWLTGALTLALKTSNATAAAGVSLDQTGENAATQNPKAQAVSNQPDEAGPSGRAVRFEIRFESKLQDKPYTGRVFIFFSDNPNVEPRRRVHSFQQWIQPAQVFARDLENWDPTKPVFIDAQTAIGYPYSADELPPAKYTVQAAARRSLDGREAGLDAGDLFSLPQELDLSPKAALGEEEEEGAEGGKGGQGEKSEKGVKNGQESPRVIDRGAGGQEQPPEGPRQEGLRPGEPAATTLVFKLDQAAERRRPEETDRIKYVEMISPFLSRFYEREVTMRAGVRLPNGYDATSDRSYPVLYMITGFGGTWTTAAGLDRWPIAPELKDQVIIIVPDAGCRNGHHVFADSENNGPVGTAFVKEFIPYLEKRFHGTGLADHRYVTGGSSGGWASLWLAVTYPDAFAECWADSPDPVDFRDFQRINLYDPGANMYRDPEGNPRPLARQGQQVMAYYESFVKAEDMLNPGGQIHSFEAVFSPRGPDGRPRPLFDHATGAVDAAVAKAWEKYDIRLTLERNWEALGPRLKGKLHVYGGEFDNFYLEGAVRLLKESLAKLGSDAEVEIIPGGGHGTMFGAKTTAMFQRIVDRFHADPRFAPPAPSAAPTLKEGESKEPPVPGEPGTMGPG